MDSFCVLPWFGREFYWQDNETHCCLLPKKYDVEKIKTAMLSGERPTECQKCWKLEDQGLQSDRQLKNATLDWYWNRDLELIKKDAELGLSKIVMVKLMTSYTCNATCVSCVDHNSSSSWSHLKHKMNKSIPIESYNFVNINELKKKVDFGELKMLSILGGEPLYEKKNFELLEHLLEIGNDSVFLSLVTNGSVTLTDRQKTVLSKFKNLNFCISIDGTELVFEYLRFPLKWNDLIANLNFFREITSNISASYTLSNLNILYHTRTVKWFESNDIPYSNNPVYTPTWLQPRALPVHIKSLLKQQLSTADFNMYIGDNHTSTDQANFERFLFNISQQDLAKNISIKDYLPELHSMLF
jgi:hypothetical protein